MTVEYQQLEAIEALEVQLSPLGEALVQIDDANKADRAAATSMLSRCGLPHGFLKDAPVRVATTSAPLRATSHAP